MHLYKNELVLKLLVSPRDLQSHWAFVNHVVQQIELLKVWVPNVKCTSVSNTDQSQTQISLRPRSVSDTDQSQTQISLRPRSVSNPEAQTQNLLLWIAIILLSTVTPIPPVNVGAIAGPVVVVCILLIILIIDVIIAFLVFMANKRRRHIKYKLYKEKK